MHNVLDVGVSIPTFCQFLHRLENRLLWAFSAAKFAGTGVSAAAGVAALHASDWAVVPLIQRRFPPQCLLSLAGETRSSASSPRCAGSSPPLDTRHPCIAQKFLPCIAQKKPNLRTYIVLTNV